MCNYCNATARLIIRLDRQKRLRFAPLQSDAARALLARFDVVETELDSVILVADGNVYRRSAASLNIAWALGGIWRVLYVFVLVPAPIRDWIYNLVAANRYRFLGKRDVCMTPTPDIRDRFLS